MGMIVVRTLIHGDFRVSYEYIDQISEKYETYSPAGTSSISLSFTIKLHLIKTVRIHLVFFRRFLVPEDDFVFFFAATSLCCNETIYNTQQKSIHFISITQTYSIIIIIFVSNKTNIYEH